MKKTGVWIVIVWSPGLRVSFGACSVKDSRPCLSSTMASKSVST